MNYGEVLGSLALRVGGSEDYAGLLLTGNNGYIDNYGHVAGNIGIYLKTATNTTIVNHGEIQGASAAIIADGHDPSSGNVALATGVSIENDGLISGDVRFGQGYNSFGGLNGTVDGNLTGGIGYDTFDLSHQVVTGAITGGFGSDTVAFSNASAGFNIDLSDGTALGAGENFTFSGIENATGSGYADTINGDDNINTINGGAGADTINGNAGADVINAGPGVDTVMGGPGDDVINGNGGADIVYGNGGADVIAGVAGADTLAGGSGNDTFVYSLVTDSPTAAPDRITDFTHGSDKINLTALHLASASDVKITTGGGLTLINIDSNHDGAADMLIQVVGTVTTSDIVVFPIDARPAHAVAAIASHHDLATSMHAVALEHGIYG